jgi:hypothetical protein
MRAPDARRPRADIVDDIVLGLRPLKQAKVKVCATVDGYIEVIADQKRRPSVLRSGAAAQRANRDAATLQTALRNLLKAMGPPDIAVLYREEIQGFANSTKLLREILQRLQPGGRSQSRTNNFHDLCALSARSLITEFSKTPLATTQGANLHTISQLLREAVTGEPVSKAGMLWSCRKVMRIPKIPQ